MTRTVVVAGVGTGLGSSVAHRFATEGCDVALLARSESYLDGLAAELDDTAGSGLAVPADLTDESAVGAAFDRIREALGPVDVLVNNASGAAWKGLRDISVDELDRAWAVGPRGGFLCAQEAVADMVDGDGGTVIFTGATTSVRGREGAVGFSAAKFAVRGIAESMARELGPEGVHVAHVVVDGQIRPDSTVADPEAYLDPDDIAETYWQLAEQNRSAWTLELDVRPHVEEF